MASFLTRPYHRAARAKAKAGSWLPVSASSCGSYERRRPLMAGEGGACGHWENQVILAEPIAMRITVSNVNMREGDGAFQCRADPRRSSIATASKREIREMLIERQDWCL
jgi:hypothetical protein